MPADYPRSNDDRPASNGPHRLERRRLLVAGAGLGAALFAGCTSSSDAPGTLADGDGTAGDGPSDGSTSTTVGDGSTDGDADVGTFRLLISDQPVAIDEFDSLNVSFDRARIFRAGGDDPEPTTTATASATNTTANGNQTGTVSPNETDAESPTVTATETEESDEEDDEEDGEQRGFFVIDLEGATVDLTQVVGDKAIGVFEGELAAGRYTKIELYAAEVDGVVAGESVDVKIPSGKLQIVKPFEVVPDESVSFVFDINVVKKGPNGYNLLPVIAKSGVAGEDVEVEEVDPGDEEAETDDEETDVENEEETGTDEEDTDVAEETEEGEETDDDDDENGPPTGAGPPTDTDDGEGNGNG